MSGGENFRNVLDHEMDRIHERGSVVGAASRGSDLGTSFRCAPLVRLAGVQSERRDELEDLTSWGEPVGYQ
jgi:hypothetical protein